MNDITLCCTSHNTNFVLLNKMLHSANGFDAHNIHLNNSEGRVIKGNVFHSDKLLTAGEGYNFAIDKANTTWISCGCDDDFYNIEELNLLFSWFRESEIKEDIIQFPILVGNEIHNDWNIWGDKPITYEGLRQANGLAFSCFYRKSLWEKICGYENVPFCDWSFWLKALKSGATIKYFPLPVYSQRQAVEQRLSDREFKETDFELTRKQLLERIDNYEVKN